MSLMKLPDRNEADHNASDAIGSQSRVLQALGAALQLLAIGLCLESMLGVADGMGVLLRIALIALIMFGIVLRLGWLSLVALQVCLFVLEPRRQPPEQTPSAFFFVLLACCVIVFAMNLPQVHRYVTDCFVRLFLGAAQPEHTARPTGTMNSRQIRIIFGSGIAIRALQMVMSVVLGVYLLNNIPIGRQSNSWLQWSREHGQAVWPGSLLLVLMISLLVLARENAWRQITSSQARLYLRSQHLIANFRDLNLVERVRLKAVKNGLRSPQRELKPMSNMDRSKLHLSNTETESFKKELP